MWLVDDRPGATHIVPLDDIVVHTPSAACICAPTAEHITSTCWGHGVAGGAGVVRTKLSHNAMDGRLE